MPGPQNHNIANKLLQREGGARPTKFFTKVHYCFDNVCSQYRMGDKVLEAR